MTSWRFDLDIGIRLNIRLVLVYSLVITIFLPIVQSSPEATFPFNAQVPLVARVGEPYNFILSATTFSSDERIIRYSLWENPTWLRIDPVSRTLSGVPQEEDIGPFDFDIIATDATGVSSMRARLVVASKPLQDFGNEMIERLEQHGALNGPKSVLLKPSQQFELNMNQKPAQGPESKLSYYATMSDHSPLPPWIIFDNTVMEFRGTTPSFEDYPRIYDLLLIASDIPGYAGATFGFSLTVSDYDFRFIPQQRTLMIPSGESFEYSGLRDALYVDGQIAEVNEIRSVKASPPPNLSFGARNFIVKGIAASEPQTFGIVAEDQYGNTAEGTLTVSPWPKGSPGQETISAFRGSSFKYEIPQVLISQYQDIQVHFAEAAPWLTFDVKNHLIHGSVPLNVGYSLITVIIEASSPDSNISVIHELALQIDSVSSTMSVPPPKGSVTSVSSPNAKENIARATKGEEKHQSNKSAIAVAVSISLSLIIITFVISLIAYKKYRGKIKLRRNLHRRNISLPVTQLGECLNGSDNSYRSNTEDGPEKGNCFDRRYSNPPQLSPIIPRRSSKRYSWQQPIIGHNEEAETIIWDQNYDKIRAKASEQRPSVNSKTLQITKVGGKEKCSSCNVDLTVSYTSQPLIVYPGDRHPPIYGDSMRVRRCHRCVRIYGKEVEQKSSNSLLPRSLSVASFTPSMFPSPPLRTKASVRRSTPIPFKQNSIRLVPKTPSVLTIADRRTISEKRQSYIRARLGGRSPFFSAGSYKKYSRSAYHPSNRAESACNPPSSSVLQREVSCEWMSDSMTTKSPSLATAEREIEEFWKNYPYVKGGIARGELSQNRLKRRGFIKESLDKLEGSSQYTSTSEVASQICISGHASPVKTQDNEILKPVRPISTKLVDRPHPLVGRRNVTQRRKTRMKSFLYLPTSKLRKRSSCSGADMSHPGEDARLDLDAKKGLGIVLGLNPYGGNEIYTDECNHTTIGRSPLSEISNSSPKPRLVRGKGKRPVSVQGIKHEDKWGSLSGLRGNEAFI